MHQTKIYIIFLLLLLTQRVISQQFGRGILLDDSLYVNSPVAAPLMRGDYRDIPSSFSLKEYSPTPGYQGLHGTCAGWCTAYSARTILEAEKNKWNQSKIDSNSFSPSFVYNQIRSGKGCSSGTSLVDALDVLKKNGCQKLMDFGYDCEREVTENDKLKAADFKIIEYREVANSKTSNKTLFVKKSIANNHPVVIAMNCPHSFNNAKEVWTPDSNDYKPGFVDGHGITVIGYDDSKFNGAFELINSWGTSWGKNGFTWVRYSDFDKFCRYAFEVLDKKISSPNYPDLSGSIKFIESSGNQMNAAYNGKYFIMDKPYNSGTLFELRISNNEPAYVYAIGSDSSCIVSKIFPLNERMVAYLPYKKNNIAIPDEDHFNLIDEKPGPAYFCFLYSKNNLDINDIINKIENGSGGFAERLEAALQTLRVDIANINFSAGGEIKFNAKSKDKFVVPILVEIPKPLK